MVHLICKSTWHLCGSIYVHLKLALRSAYSPISLPASTNVSHYRSFPNHGWKRFCLWPKKNSPRDPKNSGAPPHIFSPRSSHPTHSAPTVPFRGSFLAVSLPLSANLAMAPLGVAFEAWPPVLLYISSEVLEVLGRGTAGFPWENLEETDGLAEKVHIFHSKKPRLRTTQALAPGICVQHQDVDVFLAGLGLSPMSTGDCSRIVYNVYKLMKSLVLYWTCSCLKSQVWKGFYDEDRGLSIIGRGNLNLWIVK